MRIYCLILDDEYIFLIYIPSLGMYINQISGTTRLSEKDYRTNNHPLNEDKYIDAYARKNEYRLIAIENEDHELEYFDEFKDDSDIQSMLRNRLRSSSNIVKRLTRTVFVPHDIRGMQYSIKTNNI